MIKKIINFFFNKKEEMDYPPEFAIIDFSPVAKQNGVADEQNKIIYRYFIDRYGKRQVRKYRYSRAREKSFVDVYRIPILDKTKQGYSLPVFAKALPSEISFNS